MFVNFINRRYYSGFYARQNNLAERGTVLIQEARNLRSKVLGKVRVGVQDPHTGAGF